MTEQELLPDAPRPSSQTPRTRVTGVTYDARPVNDLDEFDIRGGLRQLSASLRAHRILILLCALSSAGLMQIYFKLFPPIYEAKVMVLSESDKDDVRDEYYKLWSTFRKNDLDTDIELATATPVIRRVVEKLELRYDDVYHPPLAQMLYLWEQSWIGKQYRRVKEWIWPKEPDPYAQSPELAELARTVRDFKAGASLSPVPGSYVGNMLVRGPTPRVAEYANTLVDEFIADRRRGFAQEARESYEALALEVEKSRQTFKEAQKAIEEFETRHALMLGFKKEEAVMGQWIDLAASIAKLEARLASQENALAVVSAELAEEPERLELTSTEQASDVKDEMRARLFGYRNDLSQMRTRLRENAPEVRELEALIAQTEASIGAEPDKRKYASTLARNENHLLLRQTRQGIKKTMAGIKAELASTRGTYAALGKQLAMLPALKAESDLLQQDLNTTGVRHKLLRERLMMAEISLATANSAPSTIKVVAYAEPPGKPTWPKKKPLTVVAVLLGALAGIGLGLFLDMISNVATRERLAVRQDLPVYGTIAMENRDAALLGQSGHGARRPAIDRLRGS